MVTFFHLSLCTSPFLSPFFRFPRLPDSLFIFFSLLVLSHCLFMYLGYLSLLILTPYLLSLLTFSLPKSFPAIIHLPLCLSLYLFNYLSQSSTLLPKTGLELTDWCFSVVKSRCTQQRRREVRFYPIPKYRNVQGL